MSTPLNIHSWSPQQQAIFHWIGNGSGSAIVEAVAGSGKTTTLVQGCTLMRGPVALCAFNKKIADEIARKLLACGTAKMVKAATFHSYGFRAWCSVAPLTQLVVTKMDDLMEEHDTPKNLRGFVKQLSSLAKQHMVDPLSHARFEIYHALVEHHDLESKLYNEYQTDTTLLVEQGVEWTERIMRASLDEADRVIDFDDMIYVPLIKQIPFAQNDWVLIDEAQDTNPARRMMASSMLKPGGRLIAVGDRHQAIYGFTGADADALDLIQQEFNCKRLPLTVSYRCPQAVVAHAQQWVSHIQAAPDAPVGLVKDVYASDFDKTTPEPTDAILCRNTRPLITLALGYIRRRIPAHVEGRDIGQQLMTLVNKWKSVRFVGHLYDKLDDYREAEITKLAKKNEEAKIAQLDDRLSSLRCIMETLHDDEPITTLAKIIDSIFKDTDGKPVTSITLSTVHKAKGREWDRVYLYGRDTYMPSQWAKQLWEHEQEVNLIYVAVTRAKKELIEISLQAQKPIEEEAA